MTKFEECMLLIEIINVELDVTSKRGKVIQFINENQEECWMIYIVPLSTKLLW